MKVREVGLPGNQRILPWRSSLLLRLIEHVSESRIVLVDRSPADLVVVYPYVRLFQSLPTSDLLNWITAKADGSADAFIERVVRRCLGIRASEKVLFSIGENLDHRPWDGLGRFLAHSRLPRLTFWPRAIDPLGCRLPYWWNYIAWPEVPRSEYAHLTRFGAYYPMEVLLTPQILDGQHSDRLNRAVWLTQHQHFPRSAIKQFIEKHIPVDLVAGTAIGGKFKLLQKYRYCVVAENSPGYGYETEKLPEARVAGCIPVGYINNPLGDFNPKSYFLDVPQEPVHEIPPLVNERPSLSGIQQYLEQSVLA